MENNLYEYLEDGFIGANTRTIKNSKIIFWLTKKDLILLVLFLFLGLIVGIPLMLINILIGSSIFAFFILFGFILTMRIGDYSAYQNINHYFKFLASKKDIDLRESKIIEKISNNNIYLKNGKVISISKVSGLNKDNLSDLELNQIIMALHNGIKKIDNCYIFKNNSKINLKEQIDFHNSLIANTDNKKKKEILEIYKKNLELIQKNNDLTINYYLVIENKNIKENEKSFQNIINDFSIAKSFLNKLDDDEVNEFIDIFLNYDKGKIKVGKDYLIIESENDEENENHYSFIAINNFPKKVSPKFMEALFELNNIDISWYIEKISIKQTKKILDKTMMNLNDEMIKMKLSALEEEQDNFNLESQEREINNLVVNQDNYFSNTLILRVKAKNLSDLRELKNKLLDNLDNLKYEFLELKFKQFEAFKQFLPFNQSNTLKDELEISISAKLIAQSCPFSFGSFIEKDGFYFGYSNNGLPVLINWNDKNKQKTNSNMIFAGYTGSGKTESVKTALIHQIIKNDTQILILDPKKDYGDFVESFGGINFEFNVDSPNKINPFKYFSEKETLQEKAEFLINYFDILFEKTLTMAEKTILNEVIFITYKKFKRKEFLINELYEMILKESNSAKMEIEKIAFNKLILLFRPYSSSGAKANILNNKNNLNLTNSLINFDLEKLLNIKNGYSLSNLFLILYLCNQKIRENAKQKGKYINIVIDEAHLFMNTKYPEIVKFIDEMTRQVRAYNGMVWLVTQSFAEWLLNEEIKNHTTAILNSASWMFVLNLKTNDIDNLDKLYKSISGLTDYEKQFLAIRNQGRGLFFESETNRVQVQVERIQELREIING